MKGLQRIAAARQRRRRPTGTAHLSMTMMMVAAAVAILEFYRPFPAPAEPFAAFGSGLAAGASINAFGASREVRLAFALPGGEVEFPIEVRGDPSFLSYQWIPARDTAAHSTPRPVGAAFIAPDQPGFYHLVIVRGADRQVIPEPTLAVMVPFHKRVGGMLNGYRIGTYVADRASRHDHPEGFLEVMPADSGLYVSTHLRLADFLTHDSQTDVWPKYVALSPRILDKLELVFQRIGARARLSQSGVEQSGVEAEHLALDVHSGFRTPAHNARVRRAARDSRHQYGDAADIAIDANGDGRVTLADERLVARAVEQVEREHPDLAGGLGLYTSGRYRTPYVHIDARGTSTRWKG